MVFDTSVVMAILNQEPGQDIGRQHLGGALLSVVNYAEIATNLSRQSLPGAAVKKILTSFDRNVVLLDKATALLAGTLVADTKQYGLSLGDRACLALAVNRNLPVLTSDKAWAEVELPIEVRLIR